MSNSEIKFNHNFFFYILILILLPSLITGPFLPDLICIILSIVFLIKFFEKKEIVFINKKIFIFFLLFTITIILSSLLSEYIKSSLSTTLVYFRFILFALSLGVLMKENIKIINLFFLISTLTAIFLSINIIIQYSLNFDLFGNIPPAAEYGRYSSLFGDKLVGGGFLTRVMFLGVIYILFIFNLKKNTSSIIFSYLVIITFGIFLSGERTAFFMLIINIILFSFYLKSFREMALKFFICFIFLFLFFTNINPVAEKRMFETTKSQILEDNKINIFSKIHQSHYVVAFNMFKDEPFLGHGVKSFREACREERYIHYNGCATHPHNFYIQFLAETGLVGFGFLLLFYLYIIYQFTKNLLKKKKNKIDFVKLILYQTIIVNLFPLMPNGNFFNNWLSVVMYIPLALVIFFETLTQKDEEYLIKKFK